MPRRRRSSKPFPTRLFQKAYSKPSSPIWWVYAIQSQQSRPGGKPGFFYVGCTNDPVRRLRQHNGELPGGAKWTSKYRPWQAKALYGPYKGRSQALKAEYALKHGKRGEGRTKWSTLDSKWCRGEGPNHPWVKSPCDDSLFSVESDLGGAE